MNNKKEAGKVKFNDGWCFAVVNGRLGEIYFKPSGIYAHCYIKRKEFSKRDQKMIDQDIKKHVFSYRKGFYYDKIRKLKHKVPKPEKIRKRDLVGPFYTAEELIKSLKI